jgi:hypothetical protein
LTDKLENRILEDSISEVLNLKDSIYSIFEVLNFESQQSLEFCNVGLVGILASFAKYRHCNLERLEIRQIFWSIEF